MAEALLPGGELIVSSYVTPTRDFNPHHSCEFTRRSLHRLLRHHGFVVVTELEQIKRFQVGGALRLARTKRRLGEASGQGLGAIARRYLAHPSWALRRGHCVEISVRSNLHQTHNASSSPLYTFLLQ